MRGRIVSKRDTMGIALLLLLGLFAASCGDAPAGVNPEAGLPADLVADQTPLPLDLVVLHTNDNWGETEPCG
ncbi:MAG: hypothetical protein GWN58_25330 [Anaerolineae bacterium]|nr:hypothetical protein [Anaerolineae bacterium]